MRTRTVLLVVFALLVPGGAAKAAPHPDAPGCPIFPANNVWHSDISGLPVHPRSAAWISSMGGPARRLHPDFGPSDTAQPYGIPYEVVPGGQATTDVSFYYDDESDPGPYPLDEDTPIEGGSDRHALMLDRDACVLYELYDTDYSDQGSTAGSGAVWNLDSNALRPLTWTSADAAGLPIFPGLIRRDEVDAGLIDHAIRVTASRTDRSFVWPARHQAGHANDPSLPPMGARFRLKSSFSLSGFEPETRVVLTAMKRHGLIVADNGSDWYFGGASENGWSGDVLDELKSVPAGAFEAVDASSLMVSPDSGEAILRPRYGLTARLRPRRIALGRRARILGTLSPALPGLRVQLQRRRDGAWTTVRTKLAAADGDFRFRMRPGRTGTIRYRVRKASDAHRLGAITGVLRLRVRSA